MKFLLHHLKKRIGNLEELQVQLQFSPESCTSARCRRELSLNSTIIVLGGRCVLSCDLAFGIIFRDVSFLFRDSDVPMVAREALAHLSAFLARTKRRKLAW